KEMVRVSSGEPLGYTQDDIKFSGHAIECRINAEDPAQGFRPSPGLITFFRPPGGYGVRVDSHAYSGYSVPPYYDSMIAKLIVHQPTREMAIQSALRCLDEFRIEGIATTIPLQRELLSHPHFQKGKVDTGFVEERIVG
ncbi:MAG: acetyl-CoA carboxylase biotin carboxylase subunit, partial [Planctomycetota bacterium]